MVSDEKGLPDGFDPGTRNQQTGQIELPGGSNVKWVARLGNQSYGSPIVVGGRVFVGTNNDAPRDPAIQGDRGVLMCFDEKTGRFLWQLVVPKLDEIKWADWQYIGLTSPPTVEGDLAYLVTNRCEALCLDVQGAVKWRFDMPAELGVRPHNGSNCSILVRGDLLYVCTSNGCDWTHNQVANPKAPSVVVLDKRTGKLVARDDFGIGADIVHGQWTSLALGAVTGGLSRFSSDENGTVPFRTLLFFGAGNGWMYAFEALDPNATPLGGPPLLLKNVWRFNGHPLAQTQDNVPLEHCHDTHSYEVTAMPVFYKERVYVTFTQEPYHNMMQGRLTCLDATKTGDVTRSVIRWSYDKIGASVSTVAIADGLVYAAGFDGRLHCLDADTGECYWVHEAGKPIWGSPLVADGKVYLGTGAQVLWVLAAGKQPKVINRIRMRDGVYTTPTAANGTLWVVTNRHLYAVGGGQGAGDRGQGKEK
jgi:outer membrane protein assembly factor BamB